MTSDDLPSFKSLFRDEDLQRGIDKSGIGIWDLDLPTRKLFWSSAARRLFGVSENDPVSYDVFLSALQPEDRARTEWAIQCSITSGCKFDIQYRIRKVPEGSRWVRARGGLVISKEGAPLRLSGVVLDIDDQKLIEEALRAREDHLRSILDTIPDAMIVIDDHENPKPISEYLHGHVTGKRNRRNQNGEKPNLIRIDGLPRINRSIRE